MELLNLGVQSSCRKDPNKVLTNSGGGAYGGPGFKTEYLCIGVIIRTLN